VKVRRSKEWKIRSSEDEKVGREEEQKIGDRSQPPAHRGLPSGLYALLAGSGPGGRAKGGGRRATVKARRLEDQKVRR